MHTYQFYTCHAAFIQWKKEHSLDKDSYPQLLTELHRELKKNDREHNNLISGFAKNRIIYP